MGALVDLTQLGCEISWHAAVSEYLSGLRHDPSPQTRLLRQLYGWGMLFEGVHVQARRYEESYSDLALLVEAVSHLYDAPPSFFLKKLYVDDASCHFYEIDLADDMPPEIVALGAADMQRLFRHMGGYNGLLVRCRGEEVLNDDPWWAGDEV